MLGRILTLPAIAVDFVRSYFGSLHHQTDEVMAEQIALRKKYSAHFTPSGNALQDHIKAFGVFVGGNYVIDDKSMYTTIVHDGKLPPDKARPIVSGSLALAYLKGVREVEGSIFHGLTGSIHFLEAAKLRHPYSSGVFNKNGEFDYEQFKKYLPYAVKDRDGKMLITLEGVNQCLDELNKHDTRWENADFIEKKFGEAGRSGEFSALFEIIPTRWVEVGPNKYVAAAKLTDLKRWYIDTFQVLQDKFEGRLALPPLPNVTQSENKAPNMLDRMLASACRFAKSQVDATPHYHASYGTVTFFNKASQPCALVNSSATTMINPPTPVGMIGR